MMLSTYYFGYIIRRKNRVEKEKDNTHQNMFCKCELIFSSVYVVILRLLIFGTTFQILWYSIIVIVYYYD